MNLDCISTACESSGTILPESEILERSERIVKIRSNSFRIPEFSEIYELRSINLKKMTYNNEMVAVKPESFSGVAAKR